MAEELYTKRELPAILKTSRVTIWKMEKAKILIPSMWVNGSPRYSADDIARAVAKKTITKPKANVQS